MLSGQIHYIELQETQIVFGNTLAKANSIKKIALDTLDIQNDLSALNNFLNDISLNLAKEKGKTLFFLHGMWESKRTHFKEAYEYLDTSYLKNPTSEIGAIVIITWDASDYFYKNVQKSGLRIVPTFSKFINVLSDFKQNQPTISLNLLCHSLGNLILHESLQVEKSLIFDKLILSAPDMPIPHENNQQIYKNIESIATNILLLRNHRDRALLFSGIRNKQKRLGRAGFSNTFETKIKVQEVAQFKDTVGFYPNLSNHMQFRCSQKVAMIMVDFLND